jgi:WhiB family redox-sensing transcriptional regulator
MSDWTSKAACKDLGSENFFYDSADKNDNNIKESLAKNICRKCPVAAECLMHAIDADEKYGIWGSFAPRERNILIKTFSKSKLDISLCKKIVNKEIKSIRMIVNRKEFI